MGSLAAYLLSNGGCETVLYEKREERREAITSRGLALSGELEGRREAVVLPPGTPEAPFDAIVVAVGARDTGDALRPVSPFVHRGTFYLSFQEGFAFDDLQALVGREKAFAALPWVAAEEGEGGVVWVEGFRRILVGGGGDGEAAEVRGLVEAMGSVFPGRVELTEDLRAGIWERVRAVAGVSSLCALLGTVPEELRTIEEVAKLADEAAGECSRLAASTGVNLEEGGSPWGEAVWVRTRPPMLRHALSGLPTEIEHLGGRLAAISGKTGVRAPVQSAMASLVRELEKGSRKPGMGNLRELERRIREERDMPLF